jgi:hypothetical protein
MWVALALVEEAADEADRLVAGEAMRSSWLCLESDRPDSTY